MKHVLVPATVAGLLALAGCAGGPDWQKPSATDAELHSAIADCKVKANKADDDDVFDDCMKGRGYTEK